MVDTVDSLKKKVLEQEKQIAALRAAIVKLEQVIRVVDKKAARAMDATRQQGMEVDRIQTILRRNL